MEDRQQILDRYGDLLGGRHDPDLERLVTDLSTVSGATEPPPALAVAIERAVQQRAAQRRRVMLRSLPAGSSRAPDRRFLRVGLRWSVVATVMLALALLATVTSTALTNVTDLGPPTSALSTDPYFPLDNFHRIQTTLRRDGKPEVLFLGAQGLYYSQISAARWSLVKALDQFGSFARISPVDRACVTQHGGLDIAGLLCTIPTYNFSRVQYRSPYLVFVNRDLVRADVHGVPHLFQPLSPVERALFNRYARVQGHPTCFRGQRAGHPVVTPCKTFLDFVEATLGNTNSARTLPLLAVGEYLQTNSQVVLAPDFTRTVPITVTSPSGQPIQATVEAGLPFATVQDYLIHDKDPSFSHLVEDVNAEANIITALICHADGKKPEKVCGRPVIRTMLKHVK